MITTGPVWRKSTFSGTNGGDCVEVAPTATGVLVRHSKRPEDGVIEFSHTNWSAFVSAAARGELPSGNPAAAVVQGVADVLVSARDTGVVLRYTQSEWDAFVAGALHNEFAFLA